MPRGHRPRTSRDPNEERMVTWRISGELHRQLTRVTNYLGMSHNRFITEVMTVKLNEVNTKILAQQTNDATTEQQTPQ